MKENFDDDEKLFKSDKVDRKWKGDCAIGNERTLTEDWDSSKFTYRDKDGKKKSAILQPKRYKSSDFTEEVTPPHLRNFSNANARRGKNVKKISLGAGPMAIMILYMLDLIIDSIISLANEVSIIVHDGFDIVFHGLMGRYYGEKSQARELEEYIKKHGSCYSYKYIRHFITLILPPLGVFMAKGLRGIMTVLISLGLTYIYYPFGMIYSFVISSRSRYGDYYERHQEAKFAKLDKDKDPSNKTGGLAFIAGAISITILTIFIIAAYLLKIVL